MDKFGNGNFVAKPDTTADISISDPVLKQRLHLKLAEYRNREAKRPDMSYDHPEYRAMQLRAGMFQGDVLDYALDAADARDTETEPITLGEVATAMENLHGYDLAAAKEAPVLFDSYHGGVCQDQAQLRESGGELNVAFSNAYFIIQQYATGQINGVIGGTGLPELEQ